MIALSVNGRTVAQRLYLLPAMCTVQNKDRLSQEEINKEKRKMYGVLNQWLIIMAICVELISLTNTIPHTALHGNVGVGG
jgi:hypothetical protein